MFHHCVSGQVFKDRLGPEKKKMNHTFNWTSLIIMKQAHLAFVSLTLSGGQLVWKQEDSVQEEHVKAPG